MNEGFIMKKLISITAMTLMGLSLSAKEINPYSDQYIEKLNVEYKGFAYEKEAQVENLTNVVSHLQKSYDEKIISLENELTKTKERLVEKSLNEEKIQEALKEKYESEILSVKKELALKTRTLLEYQRQIEKMNPSEDTKNLIKLNAELAAELRKTEGQLAALQLEVKKELPTNIANRQTKGTRMPASVEGK
jgi:hypothetical protein